MHSDASVKVCCLVLHRKFKIVTFLPISFPTSNITADHTHLYIFYTHQLGEDDPVPLFLYTLGSLLPAFVNHLGQLYPKRKYSSLFVQRDLFNFLLCISEPLWTRKQHLVYRPEAKQETLAGLEVSELRSCFSWSILDLTKTGYFCEIDFLPLLYPGQRRYLSCLSSCWISSAFAHFPKEYLGSLAISQYQEDLKAPLIPTHPLR